LFWYCERFAWTPAMKTLEEVLEAEPGRWDRAVVAFVHVEPADVGENKGAETKLVKNAKWLARKWETDRVVLHSFTHLGEEKAEPAEAHALLERTEDRLTGAGYTVGKTPYGYFHDLDMKAPGHPLARIYKAF
jgi:hypothetical protein